MSLMHQNFVALKSKAEQHITVINNVLYLLETFLVICVHVTAPQHSKEWIQLGFNQKRSQNLSKVSSTFLEFTSVCPLQSSPASSCSSVGSAIPIQ